MTVNGVEVPLAALEKAWRAPLETVFPTETPFTPPMQTVPLYTERQKKRPCAKIAKPRVLIPVWPGTNCELDTARVFELAGAVPEIQVVNNLSPAGIEDTIERIAKGVDNAQILMLPGGFSAGRRCATHALQRPSDGCWSSATAWRWAFATAFKR